MFSGCSNLSSINLSNFNTTNVQNMSYMFSNCPNLKNINLCSFIPPSNYNILNQMFNSNSNWDKILIPSKSLYNNVNLNITNKFKICKCYKDCLECSDDGNNTHQNCLNCSNGKFLNNSNCLSCYYKCETCNKEGDNITNNCLICKSIYYFLNNNCYDNCPDGYYNSNEDGECKKCYYKCKTCSSDPVFDNNNNIISMNCIKCKKIFKLKKSFGDEI